jgi:hypothetical protein
MMARAIALALCVAFGVPRACIRAADGLGKTIKQARITRSTRRSRLSHGVHRKQIMALRASLLFDFARSAVTPFPWTPWLNLLFRALRVILACLICDPHTMRISGTQADAFCQMRLPWDDGGLHPPCAMSRIGWLGFDRPTRPAPSIVEDSACMSG